MKKTALVIVFLCNFLSISAQEIILEFENDLKTSNSFIKDVIPIVNKKNGDISIFVADAKNIYGYLFNKNYKPISKLKSKEKKRKYKTIIGYSIIDKNYNVFLTNKKNNKFAISMFSFQNKEEKELKEFSLDKNEEFLQTVSANNKFYILTKNTIKEELYINTFDKDGILTKNTIDLSNITFESKTGNYVKVTKLLEPKSEGFRTLNVNINKIEENTPNSIEFVSDIIKLYLKENAIILSFDNNKKFTQVLTINLETFKAEKKAYYKPLKNNKESRKKSNSFLFKDKLFTIASTKEILNFNIIDYNSGEILKELSVKRKDTIAFKNTPIIQEGGVYIKKRKLEKTQKFLRKITAEKIGVSVIEQNDNYIITIGGAVKQASGSMPIGMPSFGGATIADFGNISLFFNPTGFAHSSFSNTKSTRIQCMFDKNFKHIKGEIPKNAFDKIDKMNLNNISNEVIFRNGDKFLQCYFNWDKKFYIREYRND